LNKDTVIERERIIKAVDAINHALDKVDQLSVFEGIHSLLSVLLITMETAGYEPEVIRELIDFYIKNFKEFQNKSKIVPFIRREND